MAAADGCALSVPGLKDVLSLNRRAPPPNVSVKKSDVHVGDNIYCQGTVNMYVDTSSPDIIKSITNRKPVTVNEGWRGRLASLSRKEKAIYLTGIISVVGALLLFVCIYFPLAYHAQQTDEGLTSDPVKIVTRKEWKAYKRKPNSEVGELKKPIKYVVVGHTNSPNCNRTDLCKVLIKNIESFDISIQLELISFNFVVAGDGKVYEGRGWSLANAMTGVLNDVSLGVAFLGNFSEGRPPRPQVVAAKLLLEKGIWGGWLAPDYELYTHRQVVNSSSPGLTFYSDIQHWSHWRPYNPVQQPTNDTSSGNPVRA